jgi:cupin 2 domain-containing protein
MTIASGNIFAAVPDELAGEQFTQLLSCAHMKIERIVSRGHASPPDLWYDQDWAEWVIVLAGAAELMIAGEAAPRTLHPGDYIYLPPHVRHRVVWTESVPATIWLAIHHNSTAPDGEHAAPRA